MTAHIASVIADFILKLCTARFHINMYNEIDDVKVKEEQSLHVNIAPMGILFTT